MAQMLLPLATADGRLGCMPGLTGIGRPPTWTPVADRDALGGWALAETASDPTDLRFPLCLSQAGPRDFDATLKFKALSGTRDQAAGLVFRAQSAADYYVVRASALDGSVRLYRMQNGRRAQLAAKEETGVKVGQWHALRVVANNNRIEAWLDGLPMFNVTDRGLPLAGLIGIWSHADSLTHFGSLLVSPAPATP